MNRFARIAVPALLLGILPLSARAEECGNMQLVTSMTLEDTANHLPIVPITIDGTPRKFLFDTGGVVIQISPSIVKELKLQTRSGNFRVLDVNGNAADKIAMVDDFAFGPIKFKNLQFLVSSIGGEDGLLTPSMFSHVDIDMDFGPRRLDRKSVV